MLPNHLAEPERPPVIGPTLPGNTIMVLVSISLHPYLSVTVSLAETFPEVLKVMTGLAEDEVAPPISHDREITWAWVIELSVN